MKEKFPEIFFHLAEKIGANLSLNYFPENLFKIPTLEILKIVNNNSSEKEKFFEHVCLERLILEHYTPPFFDYCILKLAGVLNLKGYAFFFPQTLQKKLREKCFSEFSFVRLKDTLFFYPEFFGNIKSLYFYLWKNFQEENFYSIEVESRSDVEEIFKQIELAKIFSFSRLKKNTIKKLREYFPEIETEVLKEVEEIFLKAVIPSGKNGEVFLVLADKLSLLPDSLEVLFLREKETGLFVLRGGLKDIKKITGDAGVLTRELYRKWGKEFSPLLLILGAYEHARRLKGKNVIFFEGFTYHVLGDMFYEWGDYCTALKFYKLAEPYTKQPVELALSMSAIFYNMGELEKAEKILRRELCGCEKEDPVLHYNLGLIYFKKGEPEKAEYHFFKAHLLSPEESLFREGLLAFLWENEKYEDMEVLFEEMETTGKTLSPREKLFKGKLQFVKGEREKAFKILKEFLSSKERDGEVCLVLAWCLKNFKGEVEPAKALISEAKEKMKKEQFEKALKKFSLEEI